MTIYLQSPDKTKIQAFINENQIGAGFIDWIKLTDKEITAYLLQEAKNNKLAELNKFYSSAECWTYTVFTSINQYASLTRDADFFAKLLPACGGRQIQIFTDNNVIVNYNLTIEKASNLNYQINIVNGTLLKAKKIDLENRINIANNIDDINNIDYKQEFLSAVLRNINLDLTK